MVRKSAATLAAEKREAEIAKAAGIANADDLAEANKSSEQRARAALRMAVSGADDYQIAELLHYSSPEAAHMAYERLLAGSPSSQADNVSLRRLVDAQHDAILRSLAPKALSSTLEVDDPEHPGRKKKIANEDHLAYAKVFLQVLDRKTVLHGLNAPTVSVVHTPDAAEFNAVVARLEREVKELEAGEEETEGDIFEPDANGTYGQVKDDEENDDGR